MQTRIELNDRQIAYGVLLDVERKQAYSNLALNVYISENPNCNSAFVRELVYGVLRNQFLLDYNIDRFVRKIKVRDKVALRIGFYQLCFMNSVSDYAAVDETVKLVPANYGSKYTLVPAWIVDIDQSGMKYEWNEPMERIAINALDGTVFTSGFYVWGYEG